MDSKRVPVPEKNNRTDTVFLLISDVAVFSRPVSVYSWDFPLMAIVPGPDGNICHSIGTIIFFTILPVRKKNVVIGFFEISLLSSSTGIFFTCGSGPSLCGGAVCRNGTD